MHQKTAIIFDFDGTLADIQKIFVEIFDVLALEFGFAPLAPGEIETLRSLGAREFLRTRVKVHFWNMPRLIRRAHEEYLARISEITLFPGIQATVATLREKGYRTGILSSSKSETLLKLLAAFDLRMDFVYQSSVFGKADALKKIFKREHFLIDDAIYIGDEVRDVEACRQAGIDVIAVTWGLNTRAVLEAAGAPTVDTPEELLQKLLALKQISRF